AVSVTVTPSPWVTSPLRLSVPFGSREKLRPSQSAPPSVLMEVKVNEGAAASGGVRSLTIVRFRTWTSVPYTQALVVSDSIVQKTFCVSFGRVAGPVPVAGEKPDRKSTRLNSSHVSNPYAVFPLNKKGRAVDDRRGTGG